MTEKNNEKLILLIEEEPKEMNSKSFDEDAGFVLHKRKKSGILISLGLMFALLVLAGVMLAGLSRIFDSGETQKEFSINDFSEFQRGRISGNILGAMNEKNIIDLKEHAYKPKADIKQKIKERSVSSRNLNAKKDEEILAKYASAVDPASLESVISGNPRAARRHFVPGSSDSNRGKGGVFIKGEEKSDETEKKLSLHNVKIRVRLEFSIRSTAPGTVVAVVTEDNDKIEQGAKFYGRASGHANKRTQLIFDRVIIGGESYRVKGFAIQGRDPGIESEVTDISKENLDPVVKQGVAKTLSGVAVGVAGGAHSIAGEAAGNTINPASSEVQRQHEANRLKHEYRVPAGTSFFVYLE